MGIKNVLREGLMLGEDYLQSKLSLLGYSSYKTITEPLEDGENNSGYRVLGRIGHDLEHFVKPLDVSIRDDDESREKTQMIRNEIKEEKIFMENQDEFLGRIRSVYEDFGMNMRSKVSEYEWEKYSDVVEKTATLLKKLIMGNLRKASKLEIEDAISELIDSEDFMEACQIEDIFMLDEFDEFRDRAEEYEYEDEEIKETTCAANLASLVRESYAVSDKKEKYVNAYEKYQNFLCSLTDRVIIKGGTSDKKHRDERE